jgi:excisionase family DNA binding protein
VNDKLLKGYEVAEILRVSRSYAYKLIRDGKIPKIKMGRAVRVRETELKKFLYRNTIDVGDDVQSIV